MVPFFVKGTDSTGQVRVYSIPGLAFAYRNAVVNRVDFLYKRFIHFGVDGIQFVLRHVGGYDFVQHFVAVMEVHQARATQLRRPFGARRQSAHRMVERFLMMVVPPSVVVVNAADVDDDVALGQHLFVPRADDFDVGKQQSEHVRAERLVAVKLAAVRAQFFRRKLGQVHFCRTHTRARPSMVFKCDKCDGRTVVGTFKFVNNNLLLSLE